MAMRNTVVVPAELVSVTQPRLSRPTVYVLPGRMERFVCTPVLRVMSSAPPVIAPAPSTVKLPEIVTGPVASKPRNRNA